MIRFNQIQRTLVAVVGAALLSTTFVGAAVAPAQAQAEPAQACLFVSHA